MTPKRFVCSDFTLTTIASEHAEAAARKMVLTLDDVESYLRGQAYRLA